MAKPWMTSDDLLAAIKRKITFPTSQATFTDEDLLAFANEEMMISQVPSVLQYHEEYYTYGLAVPIVANTTRYAIPDRAIGMKLRDVFYLDNSGNKFEMTRVSSEDQAFFQEGVSSSEQIAKFFLEGNDVVLLPGVGASVTGSLLLLFYIRPNQLVANSRAAIVSAFASKVVVNNATLVVGNTVSIKGQTFTAVASSPGTNEFEIGVSSVATATNLVSALNTNGIVSASNGSPSTATVVAILDNCECEFTTNNTSAFVVSTAKSVVFESIPSHILNGSVIDFLETKAGHKIKAFDISIPSNAISGNIIDFVSTDVPSTLIVGDYICEAYECIIPYLPNDLHTGLAERASARVLSAIGDKEGLQDVNAKIAEIEQRQGTLLDNRVEGAPQKVLARHSLLRYGRIGVHRGKT